MRRRLTKDHELSAALKLGRTWVTALEGAIARNDGTRVAPIAEWARTAAETAQWVPEMYLEEYEEGMLQISEPARQRVIAEARSFAQQLVREAHAAGRYTREQIMAVLPNRPKA